MSDTNVKVLVVGQTGQLASELIEVCPAGFDIASIGRPALDVTDAVSVRKHIIEFKPDLVINTSAYTAVDQAESDRELCYAVNEIGIVNIAQACRETGAFLLHVSTDFVFDGSKGQPYKPADEVNPLSVYGASKAEGEKRLLALLPEQSAIIRTAWVYSVFGNNFVKNMLRLMASKDQLGIITDQVGTPTWARGLAEFCWVVASSRRSGVYHWTDAGVASWYDFAVAIQEFGLELGLLSNVTQIVPINHNEYPTPAKRPGLCILDKSDSYRTFPQMEARHWRLQLREMMQELRAK